MIHGITPRLAEGGKIKIGGLGEVRSGKGGKYRLPEKHDRFTLTKTTRGPDIDGARGDLEVDEELMLSLMHVEENGETEPLREIPIVLHSDDIEEVFPTKYAIYHGRKLACSGDGKVAARYVYDGKVRTKETKEVACPCERLGRQKDPCKPHGTLHCSIRAPGQAVAGSLYRWRTTSIISIEQMLGSLNHILATCGVLQGLPLVLVLKPVEVDKGTVYVCHVELRAKDVEEVQKQALAMAQMRQTVASEIQAARATYRAMLEAPAENEDDEEQAEVQQEFHSEHEPPPPDDSDAPPDADEYPQSKADALKKKLGG